MLTSKKRVSATRRIGVPTEYFSVDVAYEGTGTSTQFPFKDRVP